MHTQDTGNPVLDSFVNMVSSGFVTAPEAEDLKTLHAILLEFAEKEPGGLRTSLGDMRGGPPIFGWLMNLVYKDRLPLVSGRDTMEQLESLHGKLCELAQRELHSDTPAESPCELAETSSAA